MLRLNRSTVQALIREAAAQPDREVCGLVWASEGLRAQTVHPLPNVHSDPARYYRTAPADVRAAYDAMDEEEATPLCWYHSHPGGKPDPSEEDALGAMNTGMYYAILYPEMGSWELTVWECLSPGVLVQAELFVVL